MDRPYLPRLLDSIAADLLADFPAVMLTGPRATGKTTTAVRLAETQIRLDRPEAAGVVTADPDAALRDLERPTLIDEWQAVPSILGAVKRAVDRDSTSGQFVITGSVRSDLDAATWPGTGRLLRVAMFGVTTRERLGDIGRLGFIDAVARDGVDGLASATHTPDLRDYVRELLVSGFPLPALNLTVARREVWLESYLEQVVTRDAEVIGHGRDPARLRRFLDVLAINTAGVVDDATLHRAAGIDRRTAVAYERLLSGLSLVDSLPAWWTNRVKRLVQRPKRVFTDAALAAATIRIDEDGIMRDSDILGRLLETYVIAQLRAETAASHSKANLYHLRTEQGRQEIDIIAELPQQGVIGIEVKATSAPTRHDARHLIWLREQLGDRFVAGVVFHSGSRTFGLDDDIAAVPIATLWN